MFHEYEKWSALFQLNVIWSALVNHRVCTIPTFTILVCSITTYKIMAGLPYSNIKSMGLLNYNMTKRSLYYSNLVVCFIPTRKSLPSYNIRLDLITVTRFQNLRLKHILSKYVDTARPMAISNFQLKFSTKKESI